MLKREREFPDTTIATVHLKTNRVLNDAKTKIVTNSNAQTRRTPRTIQFVLLWPAQFLTTRRVKLNFSVIKL